MITKYNGSISFGPGAVPTPPVEVEVIMIYTANTTTCIVMYVSITVSTFFANSSCCDSYNSKAEFIFAVR